METCKRCGSDATIVSKNPDINGNIKTRVTCARCLSFIRFLPNEGGDPKKFKMPFGKYKGWELFNIPQDYLFWLLSQEKIGISLRSKIEEVLNPKSLDQSCEEEI